MLVMKIEMWLAIILISFSSLPLNAPAAPCLARWPDVRLLPQVCVAARHDCRALQVHSAVPG